MKMFLLIFLYMNIVVPIYILYTKNKNPWYDAWFPLERQS